MSECLSGDWKHALLVLIILLTEAWLGRTQKTKSGSILELLFLGTLSLLILLNLKRGDKK